MEGNDLHSQDRRAFSIESWGSDPLCSFHPETGFSLNPSTVDELRWYTNLDNPEPQGPTGE